MKILVTGGEGYVGSCLVPRLLDSGHDVVVLDLMIFGGDHLRDHEQKANLEIIKGDIRDENVVKEALVGVNAIVHLAGMANDPSCDLDPELSRQINRDAPVRLADLAAEAGVQRFVYASSASVYGVYEDEEATEESPFRPVSLYAEYKGDVEKVLLERNRDGFEVVALRPATICGWSPRLRLDLALNVFSKQAWFDGVLCVHGGKQKRPNLTMKDMTRAYQTVLEAASEAVAGEVFNVGAENKSVLELAQLARDVVRKEAEIEIVPVVDPRSYQLNSEKIRKRLGFEPIHTLEEAVAELRDKFAEGAITDPNSPIYSNVRMMQRVQRELVRKS